LKKNLIRSALGKMYLEFVKESGTKEILEIWNTLHNESVL